MSLFALSSTILAVIGDDAKYNGVDVKVLIDHDVEVVTDSDVLVRQTVAHLASSAVACVEEEDEILHNGTAYSVITTDSDDGEMKVLRVRKLES